MRRVFTFILIITCFGALFLGCYAPALFLDRQFGYRDSAHYYYPLNERVQKEWNEGRWPLWEPEENAGMPLLGNPTAAVLYPGKLAFALLPYAWGARVYTVIHSALAFLGMLVLMRSWHTSWIGSALAAMTYAFGGPVLFQYCNIIFLIGAAWLPLGIHAVDQWLRLGRRWAVLELALVLSMQTLGGDPQAAYLVGLAGIGYAIGLAWARAHYKAGETTIAKTRRSQAWISVPLAVIALVGWCIVTLALAQWLPTLRESGGPPTPPFWWMRWAPLAVTVAWGLGGLGFLVYWWKRGWRVPLGIMATGLAVSAGLAVALTAIQLFPVIEFTQRTSRAADGGPHEIYAFGVEPYRLVEMVWPNFLGTHFDGNTHWAEIMKIPGVRPKIWVPSLYLGGLTLGLAGGALALRRGAPWRVWFSVIAVVSLLGSLGQYTSPIWVARAIIASTKSPRLQEWLPKLGDIDLADTTPIRLDGYLRDGDGGFYWWLSTGLPGFRQFRYPAKLFTFTALGFAILAGSGWDLLASGKTRAIGTIFLGLLVVSLVALAGVAYERDAIIASFRGFRGNSLFGPFEPQGAFQGIKRSLAHGAIVFGSGFVLTVVSRRRAYLAGVAALILMTADLAVANTRFVLTVPQSVFETEPEVLKIIEAAERAKPSPGPYRVHRTPVWNPIGWLSAPSKDRVFEFASWERDTLQPKHGINNGVNFTHTLGVAELYDYEWYFNGFPRTVYDPDVAQKLGVELEGKVVYFPRRAFDMWNTRYLILPYSPSWNDEMRGFASFMFESRSIYPAPDRFNGPKGTEEGLDWAQNKDFQVRRNLLEFPRAWVVHDVRMTLPLAGLSRETRSAAYQEILYAGDRIWTDSTQRVYDPRIVAWISSDDVSAIRPYLSGDKPRASETVKVEYPSPQKAVLEVNLESRGLVVLADVYYPGWELTVDGEPTPIYRVNGAMRGAALGKGPHTLVYTYNPRSFRVGTIVSIAGIATFLVLGLVCVRWPSEPVLAKDG